MNLQNGYKVLYATAADGKRTFLASKTNSIKDADTILAEATIGEYKLIYEKAGKIYGSTTGIPAEDDKCFDEFDAVFKEATAVEQEETVEDETITSEEEELTNELDPEDDTTGDDSEE